MPELPADNRVRDGIAAQLEKVYNGRAYWTWRFLNRDYVVEYAYSLANGAYKGALFSRQYGDFDGTSYAEIYLGSWATAFRELDENLMRLDAACAIAEHAAGFASLIEERPH